MEKASLILGIVIGALLMYLLLHLLWHLGYYTFCAILSVLRRSENPSGNPVGRLSDLQEMVLPQILKDFPDFDLDSGKLRAESFLKSRYGSYSGFQVRQLVLKGYRKDSRKKTVVFEASLSWQEKKAAYRRVEVLMETQDSSSRLCSFCGEPLQPGDRHCRSCGAAADAPQVHWEFTKIKET